VRIAALGNDMHRDWETLIAVAEQWKGCQIRIASKQLDRRVTNRAHNVDVIAATSEREVAELYSWADIATVPLKSNLHASGITATYEAVLRGVPVVCTDTGGLRAYFSEQEVRYVLSHDPAAWRRALEDLAEDAQVRFTMAKRAQARMLSADLSSRAFANRHYEISRQLLDGAAREPERCARLRRTA
jgi:glycosyltransferase involved in cell wall biosynthesis